MKILITGGSSEIGQAVLRSRLAKGDEVFLTGSSDESVRELGTRHPGARAIRFDLSTPEQGSDELRDLLRDGVDGIVLNAAPPTKTLRRLHELELSEVGQALDTQILGNVWILQQALPSMMDRKFGRVVFISSLAAQGASRYPAYCAAKAGFEGLMANLALDYGEYNMTFNSVRPGFIATKRTERFWSRMTYMKRLFATIPLGKIGEPDQVAEVVDPCLSPRCYMNGAILPVTGGLPSIRVEGLMSTGGDR